MYSFFAHSERLRCQKIWAPLKAGVAGVVIKHGRLRSRQSARQGSSKAENALKREVVPAGFTTHVAASLHQSINEASFQDVEANQPGGADRQ
jgi:hypothetical protein